MKSYDLDNILLEEEEEMVVDESLNSSNVEQINDILENSSVKLFENFK